MPLPLLIKVLDARIEKRVEVDKTSTIDLTNSKEPQTKPN